MNRHLFIAAAVCVLTLGLVATSNAWLVDTNVDVNTNSNNRRDTIGIRDGRYSSSSNANSYNQNQRYDNRRDESIHASGSFNTDNRNFGDYSNRSDNRQDNSVKDSYNDLADKSNSSVNGSYNKSSSTGDVRNSVLGDFNQLYNGTDFRSGVQGSNNTIDTSSVNITTLGDTLAK